MRLLPFAVPAPSGTTRHLGALVTGTADNGILVDLTAAARCALARRGATAAAADRIARTVVPAGVVGLAEGGEASLDAAREALELGLTAGWETDPTGAQVRYAAADVLHLPAVSDPPLLRDFMAFEAHLLNVYPRLGREIPPQWYELPVYYKGNPSATGAHGDDVVVPDYAERLDLEFELAAVIGTGGTDIGESDALGHVLGWTIYDDFSAREIQAREMAVGLGPAKGKDFIGAHVLGPVIVTRDELPDPYGLHMQARVNGEVWTDGNSSDMHWRFEQMIAHASRGELIRAGEVFGSGTVGGGSGAEQDRLLDAGDTVELEVEAIGLLRNRVVRLGPTATSA